ncbi:MAG TPA: aminopeptidase [Longimicrobiales bacterium]|nr:aminopeptidase [Longimicrobiales bacterium]
MSSRRPRRWLRAALALAALSLAASCMACSPVYVVKAGIAEMQILRARQPIHRVINDSATDADTRAKLSYVLEARQFAAQELGIDVGESYTMYTELERDTLALVVSAAPKDQLGSVTWWFPIVGRVPYRGFFSEEDALEAAADLEADGYDTYVRPTAAFSTLGWFNDPLLSTALRTDDVEVVTTVLHELAHQHLFVPGHVDFNESFANFVGRVAAIQFFCTREGGGPDTVRCQRAQARWRDYQRFSVFIDELRTELEWLYYRPEHSYEEKLTQREEVFAEARRRFAEEVQPTLEALTFQGFLTTPMNNATLLGRLFYYNRLPDFDALLEQHGGSLTSVLAELRARAGEVEDPFELLPSGADSGAQS